MYKKSVMHVHAKLLFCFSQRIAFLTFSLPSPSSLLKLLNTLCFVKEDGKGHCADRSGERSAESSCTNSMSAMTAIFSR